MSSDRSSSRPHSEQYFGEERNFWWNDDFIALMARRWRLADVRSALDVGAGVGHWGRLLLPHLAPDATLVGVDREVRWVRRANEHATRAGLEDRVSYREADLERLPFDDESFDLVTCQTVLMHVRDPVAALREMLRVTRCGGLLAVAEPNNLANTLVLGSTSLHASPEGLLEIVRLILYCHRGREALGDGNSTIGELLPGMFATLGLEGIQTFQSDKAAQMFPPYSAREQQVRRATVVDWADRGLWYWDRAAAQRYFVAGGGRSEDFEPLWNRLLATSRATADALRDETESGAGGGILYLVAGRRPMSAPRDAGS